MITIAKAHWLVKFGLNKLDSTTFTDVQPNEIDEALNKVQLTVVRNKLGQNKGLEFNRAITTDLAPILIRSETITPTGSNEFRLYPNNTTYDCLQYVRGDITAVKNNCTKTIPIIDREYDDQSYIRQSQQQKSSFLWKRAIGYFGKTTEANTDGTSLFIDTSGEFTCTNAIVDYLKYPRPVCVGGYDDIDGSPLTTSEFEFQDTMIYEIIYYAIFEIAANLQYQDAKTKFDISQLTNIN